MTMRYGLPFLAALALVACGRSEGQGGLTAEEEHQLDEAARMLDDNMIDVSTEDVAADQAELDSSATPKPSAPEDGR